MRCHAMKRPLVAMADVMGARDVAQRTPPRVETRSKGEG